MAHGFRPLLFLSLLWLAVLPAFAQEGRITLVRNVSLADPNGQQEDRVVNLLIEDGTLPSHVAQRYASWNAELGQRIQSDELGRLENIFTNTSKQTRY